MKRSILEEEAGKVGVATLTLEQYEEMVAKGILTEGAPIELIDGLLVLKDRASAGEDTMTVGAAHQLVMNKLARLVGRFDQYGCFLAIQGPIRIPPDQEPEPDASVIRGQPEKYAARHPEPQDVLSIVEVSDSSLERDRTTKQRIYAMAGIPQYIIVNLVERCVELRFSPDLKKGAYKNTRKILPGSTLSILVDTPHGKMKYLPVLVSELLP